MGYDSDNNYQRYKEKSDNLINNYYKLSYKERKFQYKKYVRREFKLFYEYLPFDEKDTSRIDKIFSIHQESEKKILKYSKEEPCSCMEWTIAIIITLMILGLISEKLDTKKPLFNQ